MYTKQSKKMLIINILDILKNYSDREHRLSQKEIVDKLEHQYQMKTERKAVKRNLMNLLEFGYPIEFSENTRINKNGEEEIIYTDWYMEHDFSDSELRLLIDSLLFSKHIPNKQCKELIKKIEHLSSQYFSSRVRHISNLPETIPESKELFYTIEVLDEAINKGRQVQFQYCSYDVDKKLHPRLKEGNVRNYLVNPYQMVATNGRYYLICNYDKYDGLSNYRIDRISNIHMLDTKAKSKREVHGLENGLNLPRHMAEHIYMFSGESCHVTFRAKRYLVSEIIDWFGMDVRFSDVSNDEVTASVPVNQKAMHYWAMQYANHVKVLSPKELVNEIRDNLTEATKKYLEKE